MTPAVVAIAQPVQAPLRPSAARVRKQQPKTPRVDTLTRTIRVRDSVTITQTKTDTVRERRGRGLLVVPLLGLFATRRNSASNTATTTTGGTVTTTTTIVQLGGASGPPGCACPAYAPLPPIVLPGSIAPGLPGLPGLPGVAGAAGAAGASAAAGAGVTVVVQPFAFPNPPAAAPYGKPNHPALPLHPDQPPVPSTVPEPRTLALVATGLVALLLRRRMA